MKCQVNMRVYYERNAEFYHQSPITLLVIGVVRAGDHDDLPSATLLCLSSKIPVQIRNASISSTIGSAHAAHRILHCSSTR